VCTNAGSCWHPNLEKRRSNPRGSGIFAKAEAKEGERLAIFGGTVVLIDEMYRLPEQTRSHTPQIADRSFLRLV